MRVVYRQGIELIVFHFEDKQRIFVVYITLLKLKLGLSEVVRVHPQRIESNNYLFGFSIWQQYGHFQISVFFKWFESS